LEVCSIPRCGLVFIAGRIQLGDIFNDAPINAVKQWKYSPTLLNGKAIPVIATVTITFAFDKNGSPKVSTSGPKSGDR
jgi:hypothetical protein